MTSVTNIHHFSDGDVRQASRISFGRLSLPKFVNHDQPSARPAFAIHNHAMTKSERKTKAKASTQSYDCYDIIITETEAAKQLLLHKPQ